MKVAFLEDVANVAKAGQVKEVADGYARNFLIPQKLATLAGPGVASTIEAQHRAQTKKQGQQEAELVRMARRLNGQEITLEAKAGAKDRLYGRVTSADIASQLERATGLAIDKRKVELTEAIRQLGSYEVTIRLGKDITPKIKVTVTEKGGN